MGLKIMSKNVKAAAETSKEIVDNKTKETLTADHKTETVEVPAETASAQKATSIVPDAKPLCEVGVDVGYTHNLGNYQSARMGVSIKIPCLADEVDAVYDYASDWCSAKLSKMIEEVSGGGEGGE